eukprot:CAMPEP_0172483868 /NCGR_PEP_ID=MMETSP1066-20121228/11062_1 /TAXON_ID=671091 /ORGANISM="Coscinodiscus wailesii, Strain CCMP2513" /LENGTH=494 /DNA_ID=CAMNT_0013248017 /DNA_START=33 /DNA_END=1517 /DNA_ORIENTATION=+
MAKTTYTTTTDAMTRASALPITAHQNFAPNTPITISTTNTAEISISATAILRNETKQTPPSAATLPVHERNVKKNSTNNNNNAMPSDKSVLSSEPTIFDNSNHSYLNYRDPPIDGTLNPPRSYDVKSVKDDEVWGWFDSDHNADHGGVSSEQPGSAVTAPNYVLEESLSVQDLWKQTAGNRPPQPVEDRAYFEMIWAQNFARSQVAYDMPLEILTASSPISLSPFADNTFADDGGNGDCSNYNLAADFNTNAINRIGGTRVAKNDKREDPSILKSAEADAAEATITQRILRSGGAGKQNYTSLKSLGPHHHHHTFVNIEVKGTGSGGDLRVLVKGDNVFGTTVSKSFTKSSDSVVRGGNDTVSISIGSYRVVESKKHGKYAQYLVIYCEGSFRNTVGVWKRYSDFAELRRKISVTQNDCHPLSIATDEGNTELLPNALTSWRLLKKRQKFYRCLDAGYLSLKVFLLERFLHDILFESSNPRILRDFVGVDAMRQ